MAEQDAKVLADLDHSPEGELGIIKRLTASDYSGNMIYHIFEYVPKPWPDNPNTYEPARGIDLTEEELRELCKVLRVQLYNRNYNNSPDDINNEFNEDDFSDILFEEESTDKEKMRDDDSVYDKIILDKKAGDIIDLSGPEFNREIPDFDCFVHEEFIEFPSGIKCCFISWHKNMPVYDIREWSLKMSRNGNWMPFPEIDKGISLDDYEAEVLCQAIEKQFLDISQFTYEYKDKNWNDKTSSFYVHLSPQERRLALGALELDFRTIFVSNSSRTNRGSRIGSDIGYRRFLKMGELSRKVKNGERFSDEEILLCSTLFETAADNFNEGPLSELAGDAFRDLTEMQIHDGLVALSKRFDNIVKRRNRLLVTHDWISQIKKIDATISEFNIASEVFQLLQNTIYDDSVKSSEIKILRRTIDKLVKHELEERNKFFNLDSEYKENPGKNFFNDFIVAFLSTGQF